MSKDNTGYSAEDSLATKLAKVGKEIGAVKKDGKNSQQGYSFIQYAAVGGRIREIFEKHHIIVIPEVESYEKTEIENKYGNKGFHYVLWMKFLVVNGDKPDEEIERKWLSEAADYGDKGINKAETAATKYFLMRLLNITEIGEKEADEVSHAIVKQNAPRPKKATPPENKWESYLVDYDEIQERLDAIDNDAELTEYSKELGVKHPKLTETQKKTIGEKFNRKREELKQQ